MRDLPFLVSKLFGTPHLIRQSKLDQILTGLAPVISGAAPKRTRLADDDIEALGLITQSGPRLEGNIAVLPIMGTLVRRLSWIEAESGLTSYKTITDDITQLMLDPYIRGVILEIDSYGGEAGGVFDLADFIRKIQRQTGKPIYAHANENAASAAYAIACAAEKVWVARTGEVGSIGVICAHLDQSQADEKAGLRWTFISAGERKTWGNPHEPLGDEARARVQADVDWLYDEFVKTVARYRGMRPADIRATKADVFRGEDAVGVGLADASGTLDECFDVLSRRLRG
ncbi:peptidase S49 [Rhodomicrobium vannielii ATCC 17100]|uniref:Peptidase S49 n=1 Tax=Rhodomicrobium vannielii (strain ATCC 17100 / DSM 162 / LMG 4299 / NCIMB 10020 / ATH 3.1.1) TaxID=648757 RepID=E3I1I5_RHOVT|nr:S49 family peptidase [Rhodomicrobium vannielii]ADP71276.1 peptidase S49 [Rhodomicrobium vannielii ATCC 17100]